MFVCFGYDVETPSNSHLYMAAQQRPKKKRAVNVRRKSDTSTSDDEPDVNNCRSTTNGEPADIFAASADDPLDQHDHDAGRTTGDLYGAGDPCEDMDLMNMDGMGQDMGDLYDPCAYEDPYGGGADVYGGNEDDHDDDYGAGAPEGFCPWDSAAGHNEQEHEDDYDHFYAGNEEEMDGDGDMGDMGMDFGGGGGEEGADDVGGADYGGGDYGGGGCATGDDFGGDDFGGDDFGYDDFGGDGGGGYDDSD